MENPILKRRSVRKFKDKEVESELIDRLHGNAVALPCAVGDIIIHARTARGKI